MFYDSFKQQLEGAYGRLKQTCGSEKHEKPRQNRNNVVFREGGRPGKHALIRRMAKKHSKRKEKNADTEQDNIDRTIAAWTAVVGIYTRRLFWATAVLAVISGGTLWAIKGQLDAMQFDQRPWIKVEVLPGRLVVERLPTDKDGPVIFFFPHLKMTNIGKSPAFNTTFSFDTYVAGEGHNDPHSAQRELCKKIRDPNNPDSLERKPNGIPRDYISALGTVLFPGDFFTESHEYGVRMVGIIGEKALRYMQKPKDKYYVHFFLIGCVDYIFGAPSQHHQTGFVYAVSQVDGDAITPFFDASENVPESKIRIFPSQSSSIAD